MKKIKLAIGLFSILIAALAIYFVLKSDHALVANPKGIMARRELDLITTNILIMLSIVVPTNIALFIVAWKYNAKNSKTQPETKRSHGAFSEFILWIPPAIIVAIMIAVNWKATYELDPYRPLQSEVKPLNIQVVALDWKWLFIYPEQGIAAVNFVQFPAETPIHFSLSADDSPMNSFWIPQLSGQIYTMTGMVTPLHLMADGPGEYIGRAAEINGEGLADMVFTAKSTSLADFEDWVASVKKNSQQLTKSLYQELVKPSTNNPIALYSDVEKNLFDKIVMKYLPPNQMQMQ